MGFLNSELQEFLDTIFTPELLTLQKREPRPPVVRDLAKGNHSTDLPWCSQSAGHTAPI